MNRSPSVAAIEAAWAAIPDAFRGTPQFVPERLSQALGVRTLVKVETVNPIRSFKARGASWFAARRGAEIGSAARARGVGWVTGSAGNFGQGLAWAARRARIPLTVYSAVAANPDKVAAMRALGAEVRLEGADFDAAKDAARRNARETGAVFVEDGREPEITEGAGTIALECLRHPDPGDLAVIPVGNGALIGGMSLWIRRRRPDTTIVGVVAAGAPVMRRAFRTGDASPSPDPPVTCADGIAVRAPVRAAVELMREVVDEVVVVGEPALRESVRLLHETLGLVVEPAGAAGIAAILDHRERFRGHRVFTPLCGGNANPALLRTRGGGAR